MGVRIGLILLGLASWPAALIWVATPWGIGVEYELGLLLERRRELAAGPGIGPD